MSKRLQWNLVGIMVILLFALIVTFKPITINGHAMEPKYKNGEYYLALRHPFFKPQRGDVVSYKYELFPEFIYMGRIVGIPTDKLVIKNGIIELNGQVLDEDYLVPGTVTTSMDKAVYKRINESTLENVTVKGVKLFSEGQELDIPNDSYFILGDNRTQSVDSRGIGFIRNVDIQEKLMFKYR